MGKHNRRDWRFCLTGLVAGALLAATPQSARAEDPADSEAAAPAAETVQENTGAEDGQPSGGEIPAREEADEDLTEDFGKTEPAEGDAASGAAAEDPAQPVTSENTDGPPEQGEPADGQEIPANVLPGPVPARAREPMTGADEPYEPAEDAGAADEEGAEFEDEDLDTGDPLEGMNRVFFQFNDFLDKLLLKPAAQLYRFILPNYVEDRVRNVVNNADSPVILANDILQWKWDRAWNTTSRFFINTTLGVGGIWDVAASFGIERHDEDFGQTLCVWGVNEWVYLYLPFVGPTSPRDLTGKVVDRFFDPLSYYADVVQQIDLSDGLTIRWNVDTAGWAQIALTAADLIDMRARNIETINEIERTSIDFYTAVRSLYRQSRENACNDGKVDFEDLPDLSEEFE